MRRSAFVFLFAVLTTVSCKESPSESVATSGKIENVIIITTDGLRWQELFAGMDSVIALKKEFVHGSSDSNQIFGTYWAATAEERRKKLLPFFWTTIAAEGQIYGNRNLGNKVDCANPYWFSYPGYNEIFTGYPDTTVNSNEHPANPHTTVLEFINRQPGFQGQVAAFAAWGAFDRILNKERCGFPVISAFSATGGDQPTEKENLLNNMLRDSYKPFGDGECLDVFTHYMALEHLKAKQPRVLFIGYGETDEWAHHGNYKDYLDATYQWDQWLKDIWDYVQSTPKYKDKTALFITTDHGRGDIDKNKWTSHGSRRVEDSYPIWMAAMGPGLDVKGEVKSNMQLYQQQSAQTIASLLGLTYTAEHPIADAVKEIFEK